LASSGPAFPSEESSLRLRDAISNANANATTISGAISRSIRSPVVCAACLRIPGRVPLPRGAAAPCRDHGGHLSSELPVYYPDVAIFAPDLIAVLDVDLSSMVDDAVARAEEEARRAADEARRAADEARRAAEEARRAERLAAKLRELGVDPDEID
jgi:hypothetical protein